MVPLGEENKPTPFADWTQIDSILLDLDGTLLDLNFDLHFWLEYLPQVYSEKNNNNQPQTGSRYSAANVKCCKGQTRLVLHRLLAGKIRSRYYETKK